MFVCLFQGGFCLTDMSEFAEILKVVTPLYDLPCGGHTLTGAIFETGAYGVPSKSQKSFICGGVRQTINLELFSEKNKKSNAGRKTWFLVLHPK